MATKSFSSQVDAWARQSQERMKEVFQMASTEVIEEMQKAGPSKTNPDGTGAGNMPVGHTGNLRNSLQVELNSELPPANRKFAKGERISPQADIEAVIAGADIGDKIVAGYTAIYALRINYGFSGQDSLGRTYNQDGYLFVEKAMQKWPDIVNAVVARLKGA